MMKKLGIIAFLFMTTTLYGQRPDREDEESIRHFYRATGSIYPQRSTAEASRIKAILDGKIEVTIETTVTIVISKYDKQEEAPKRKIRKRCDDDQWPLD